MAETIFSKIVRGEVPADVVFEDDDVMAFRDINPQAPIHVLVIPKRPIATLNDAAPDDVTLLGKLISTATHVARELGVADEGYRTVINCNPKGGQDIYHIHLHLLAGRQMTWPPG
ncbi:MAG: histidine triad nucleotide-binding protein [Candidatus Competibacterales bacterium]